MYHTDSQTNIEALKVIIDVDNKYDPPSFKANTDQLCILNRQPSFSGSEKQRVHSICDLAESIEILVG